MFMVFVVLCVGWWCGHVNDMGVGVYGWWGCMCICVVCVV